MALQVTASSTDRTYSIVYTVLAAVIFIAVLPFALIAFVSNRQRKDPARRFVPWFKAAFVFFILTLGLLVVQGILTTYEIYADELSGDIIRALYHVGYLYELFRTVLAALLTVALLQLSPGLHQAVDGITTTFDKLVRIFAYVLGAVVIALAVAYYGLLVDLQENYTNNFGTITQYLSATIDRARDINRLMSATAIILWVESLVITGLSVYAFTQRRFSGAKTASVLYLAASLLNLLSSTWNFAYAVRWSLNLERQQNQPNWVFILTIILSHWSQGLVLIIAFFVAKKSRSAGGIWSGRKTSYGPLA